jgi:RHS repeat-associated protein
LNYIYVGGSLVAIYEQKSTGDAMHYVYTDYLGSLRCITDANGNVEERLGFNAWGNRRDPLTGEKGGTGLLTSRGYTGQEHLDEFGLINLNARIYDPMIGMFISPDNYIQSPDFTQNYNRYTYCLNNPLMYKDPSGNFYGIIIGAFLGGFSTGCEYLENGRSFWEGAWKGAVVGAAIGAVSFGFSELFQGASESVMGGMIFGAASGALTGTLSAGINNSLSGRNFWDGAGKGAMWSSIFGGVSGGITGGIKAYNSGKNIWWGNKVGCQRNQWSFFNWDKINKAKSPIFSNPGDIKGGCVLACIDELTASLGDNNPEHDQYYYLERYKEYMYRVHHISKEVPFTGIKGKYIKGFLEDLGFKVDQGVPVNKIFESMKNGDRILVVVGDYVFQGKSQVHEMLVRSMSASQCTDNFEIITMDPLGGSYRIDQNYDRKEYMFWSVRK